MDLAVLSDIHGNYHALECCINYALSKNIKTFIFLGDYVGDLAYPEKTMQRIYNLADKYECYFIKGNKEDYWIAYKYKEVGWKDDDSTTGSLLYTYKHLSDRDIEFFKGLPISQKISVANLPQITICHGSPLKVNEKLLPDEEKTYAIMEANETPIIICGHTHIQNKIENNGKVILNPGAVGVPLYSNGKTQFLIMHGMDHKWEEEFVSLEYNVEAAIDDLKTSKLDKHAPYWCIVTENLLRSGEISHGTVLSKAMSLCKAETGSCIWPNVPEKYWERAIEDIYQIETGQKSIE